MATWDKTKDLESAQALQTLNPAILVVGHGPALRNPGDAMAKAVARAADVLAEAANSPATPDAQRRVAS